MRLGKVRSSRGNTSTSRMLVLGGALLIALLGSSIPAEATIVSAPGSTHVQPGGAVTVTVTTDGTSVEISGDHRPFVSVGGPSGSAPTFRFTFTVGSSTAPGSYGYTFYETDGDQQSGFSVIVDPAPTTTTQPSTTTSTSTTTTTRATTTTPAPPEETTTSSTSTTSPPTTTVPPTTTSSTTTSTSTTTTIPPSTTTSTLVPAAIASLDDGDSDPGIPIEMAGAGVLLLALAVGGAFVYWKRKPAYGAASSRVRLSWRNRSQRRKVAALSRQGQATRLKGLWSRSAPIASFRGWRTHRSETRELRRKIEERRRLQGR